MTNKLHIVRLLIVFSFLLVSKISFPQFVEPKFDEISPVIIPRCVIQDSYGFIWICSVEGLVKYDGNKLKSYNHIPYDSTSISNNSVLTIAEDEIGNLWIGTKDGLNYFDQKTDIFTIYKHNKNNPSSIGSDRIAKIQNKYSAVNLNQCAVTLFIARTKTNGFNNFYKE